MDYMAKIYVVNLLTSKNIGHGRPRTVLNNRESLDKRLKLNDIAREP